MSYIAASLQAHRADILAAAARHGARSIRVFGSVARGQSTEASDIDFLVEMGDDSTLLDRAALMLELRSILGCDVDVVTERSLKPRMRAGILREAVSL
jgi:predicted nucleotidyltransferase